MKLPQSYFFPSKLAFVSDDAYEQYCEMVDQELEAIKEADPTQDYWFSVYIIPQEYRSESEKAIFDNLF